jgi:hypothetical protein
MTFVNEMERIKENVVADFEILFKHVLRNTNISEWQTFRPSFEPGTSRIQSRNVNHCTVT